MVLYKLYKIARTFKDGRDDKANNHWFGRVVTLGEKNISQMAEQVSYATTATPSDCEAVIESLINVIRTNIGDSKSVKIDGIGTFKLGLECEGAESPGDFSVTGNIHGAHVIFTPEFTLDSKHHRHYTLLEGIKFGETPENKVVKL